jgi:hypothetical protein
MEDEILKINSDFKNEIINIIKWFKNDSESEITDKETLKQYMIFTIISLIRYTLNKILEIVDIKNLKQFNKIKSKYVEDKYKLLLYYLFDTVNNYYDNNEDTKYFLNDDNIIYINRKNKIKYKKQKIINEYLNNLIIIIDNFFVD